METVIVTINIDMYMYDIEVPCDIPAGVLLKHIEETVRDYNRQIGPFPNGMHMYIKRLNRILKSDETFDDAGVWNGDYIELRNV